MCTPPHLTADKPGIFQRLDVLGCRSKRYVERLGDWLTVRSPRDRSRSIVRRVASPRA